jgi:hypothetical protein
LDIFIISVDLLSQNLTTLLKFAYIFQKKDLILEMENVLSNGILGDGVCQVITNTPECCYDGGDCFECPTCTDNRVNDGICDEDLFTEKKCCFDVGDCSSKITNGSMLEQWSNDQQCSFPGLTVARVRKMLQNGVCDRILNTTECHFDFGECLAVQFRCHGCSHQNANVSNL